MSAGGLIGMVLNLLFFAAFWTVLGVVVDKMAVLFNISIHLMPTYQDAVTGFGMMQTIYALLPVIVFFALIINYWVTENSASSGEV